MTVIAMAVIGKDNRPLYTREFHNKQNDENIPSQDLDVSDPALFGIDPVMPQSTLESCKPPTTCSLRQQFVLHEALDRFEQISGPPPGCAWRKAGVSGSEAMFAGVLCSVEDTRVYGERE